MKKMHLFSLGIVFMASALLAQTISTPVFTLKDGDASSFGNAGLDQEIFVSGAGQQAVGWIVFQTSNIDRTGATKALLNLFVKSISSPGTLKVYGLKDSIAAMENNVALSLIHYTAASPVASILLSSFSLESEIQLDITTAFKGQNFYGIALASDDGFEGTFSSKEGTLQPVIIAQYDASSIGSKFFTGTAAPANTIGNNGDIYINTVTGDLFNKVSGGWVAALNLRGPAGSAASNLLRGAGAPAAGLGSSGDMYINISNGDLWSNANGTWAIATNLQGPAGIAPQFINGAADPASTTQSNNGDEYLNTTSGDLFAKASGTWTKIANIKGPAFAQYRSGAGVPSSSLGSNGDEYVNSQNGDLYSKSNNAWAFVVNLAGPTGPTGPQGVTGPVGAKGATGATGLTGPTGPTGVQGATGSQGAAGTNGKDGANGSPGLNWRGGWAANANPVYAKYDGVSYNGSSYIATAVPGTQAPNLSASTPWQLLAQQGIQGPTGSTGAAGTNGINGTNGTNGINGLPGLTWQNTWSAKAYKVGDAVFYNGSSYIAVLATLGTQTPNPTSNSPWQLLAQQGSPGTNGTNGTAGTNGTNGTDGKNGTNGSRWLANKTDLSNPLDMYLDPVTDTVYQKNTSNVWQAVCCIKGLKGDKGDPGTSAWHDATGSTSTTGDVNIGTSGSPNSLKLNSADIAATLNLLIDHINYIEGGQTGTLPATLVKIPQ
jgi:hypothetical protein